MSDINDTQENNAVYFDDDLYHDDEYDYVSEEVMFENGYVGDSYEGEYDFLDDELPVAFVKVSPMMTKYPMAVKISARAVESFPTERYLFVADGYCVLNTEAWPLVTVKNGTVSTMRINAQDTLYYFPDSDDQQSYMNKQRIVIKKEDMLLQVSRASEAITNHNTLQHEDTPRASRRQDTNDYDDIPF